MSLVRIAPHYAAEEILQERFPEATTLFLAGSVIRNEGTRHSDLDLVVVYKKLPAAFRESFNFKGWPIEAFVHDPETLKYFFEEDNQHTGIPSLAMMVMEGKVIPAPSDFSDSIKNMAKAAVENGPRPLGEEAIKRMRYAITDTLDDMKSPRNDAELLASAARLHEALADFYLRANGKWSAKGKSIPRVLAKVDLAFAGEFQAAFEKVFSAKSTDAVFALSEKVLAPFGGTLFDGYKLMAPADWRRKL